MFHAHSHDQDQYLNTFSLSKSQNIRDRLDPFTLCKLCCRRRKSNIGWDLFEINNNSFLFLKGNLFVMFLYGWDQKF